MNKQDTFSTVTGSLYIKVVDKKGMEILSFKEKNLIVQSGYNLAAHALAGDQNSSIDRVAIGSSSKDPELTDNSITTPTYTSISKVEYLRPGSAKFHFRFAYGDAVGLNIKEFGLFAANGQLFSRKTSSGIQKTEEMSIVGAWEINFLENE